MWQAHWHCECVYMYISTSRQRCGRLWRMLRNLVYFYTRVCIYIPHVRAWMYIPSDIAVAHLNCCFKIVCVYLCARMQVTLRQSCEHSWQVPYTHTHTHTQVCMCMYVCMYVCVNCGGVYVCVYIHPIQTVLSTSREQGTPWENSATYCLLRVAGLKLLLQSWRVASWCMCVCV